MERKPRLNRSPRPSSKQSNKCQNANVAQKNWILLGTQRANIGKAAITVPCILLLLSGHVQDFFCTFAPLPLPVIFNQIADDQKIQQY